LDKRILIVLRDGRHIVGVSIIYFEQNHAWPQTPSLVSWCLMVFLR
jgi:hypothetical protein